MPTAHKVPAKPLLPEKRAPGQAKSRGLPSVPGHDLSPGCGSEQKSPQIKRLRQFQIAADRGLDDPHVLQEKSDAAYSPTKQMLRLQSAADRRPSNLAILQKQANAAVSGGPVVQRVEAAFSEIKDDYEKIAEAIAPFCRARNLDADTETEMHNYFVNVKLMVSPDEVGDLSVDDFLQRVLDAVPSNARQQGSDDDQNSVGNDDILGDQTDKDDVEQNSKRWQTTQLPGEDFDAYAKRVQKYIDHVEAVTPEELGVERFSVSVPDWLEKEPMSSDKINDKTHLLAPVADEGEEDAAITDFSINKFQQAVKLATQQALKHFPNSEKAIMITAVLLVENATKLFQDHGDWKKILDTYVAEGPLAKLSDSILEKVLTNYDSNIKEMVPWGSGKRHRNTASKTTEGAVDTTYNVGGLVVDVSTLGLSSPVTAAIGGAYKSGFAHRDAKRGGRDESKAEAIAAVNFVVQFLQGLIPIYGSVVGIAGGLKQIFKAANPKKLVKKRKKGFTPKPVLGGGDPRVFGFLQQRINEGNALLAQGEAFEEHAGFDRPKKKWSIRRGKPKGSQAKEVTGKLLSKLTYLERQLKKSTDRQTEKHEKGKAPLITPPS